MSAFLSALLNPINSAKVVMSLDSSRVRKTWSCKCFCHGSQLVHFLICFFLTFFLTKFVESPKFCNLLGKPGHVNVYRHGRELAQVVQPLPRDGNGRFPLEIKILLNFKFY